MQQKTKKITVELTEFDLELIFQGLGMLHNDKANRGHQLNPIEILFEKLYKSMGVKI